MKVYSRYDAVSAEAIAALVDRFYTRVQDDPELAPFFERAIAGDWDPHLATMRRFWASVLLRAGTYHGNPVQVHGRLPGIGAAHFERWLALFHDTVGELFESPERERICHKASLIAATLSSRVCGDDASAPPLARTRNDSRGAGDAPARREEE